MKDIVKDLDARGFRDEARFLIQYKRGGFTVLGKPAGLNEAEAVQKGLTWPIVEYRYD